MAKIDLESLSIEELAALRDNATDKLAEKVAARQAELEAELELLSRYGKVAKKSPTAPAAKPNKDTAAKDSAIKDGAAKDSVAKAA
jgi:DNA-binding protein H-NS